MTSDQPQPAPPPPPPQPDRRVVKTDEILAAEITDQVPGTNEEGKATDLGNHVFSAVRAAITAERERCAGLLRNISRMGMREAERSATLSNLDADPRKRQMLAGVAGATRLGALTLERAAKLIERAPGSCPRCAGEGTVPAKLVPGETVPCPSCHPPANGAEGTS